MVATEVFLALGGKAPLPAGIYLLRLAALDAQGGALGTLPTQRLVVEYVARPVALAAPAAGPLKRQRPGATYS